VIALAAIIAAFAVLGIAVPYLVLRKVPGVIWRRARRDDGVVALTFDDGPDPAATPIVLDLLAAAGVRATFFVSGACVDAHPDLVRRALAEGHEIASHGYHHRHALFGRWPLAGFFDTRTAVRRLRALAGPIRFYRGPFGNYSWSVLASARLSGVQPVNWSVTALDWHPASTPAEVARRVLELSGSGDVICMHDGGRGGQRAIHALGPVLAGFAERGLRPVTLSELWRCA
jgi:peptidoglycan-N-acetylglucosamine deacetylase